MTPPVNILSDIGGFRGDLSDGRLMNLPQLSLVGTSNIFHDTRNAIAENSASARSVAADAKSMPRKQSDEEI